MRFIPQGTYLQLLAKTVYFLPIASPILVEVNSFQRRLWLRYGTVLAYLWPYLSETFIQ
jgi:hypothetical protein